MAAGVLVYVGVAMMRLCRGLDGVGGALCLADWASALEDKHVVYGNQVAVSCAWGGMVGSGQYLGSGVCCGLIFLEIYVFYYQCLSAPLVYCL